MAVDKYSVKGKPPTRKGASERVELPLVKTIRHVNGCVNEEEEAKDEKQDEAGLDAAPIVGGRSGKCWFPSCCPSLVLCFKSVLS